MSRIACIDMLFNRPPDGGAPVDLKEIVCQYPLALIPVYKQQVLQALHIASNLIAYNNYMEKILSPYNEKITVIPSAVVTSIFKAEARVP